MSRSCRFVDEVDRCNATTMMMMMMRVDNRRRRRMNRSPDGC